MLRLNSKQREVTEKAILNLMTVALATLVGGNVISAKFTLPLLIAGCIIAFGAYVGALLIHRWRRVDSLWR